MVVKKEKTLEAVKVTSKNQFSIFINLVDDIYAGQLHYIAPVKIFFRQIFDKRKNPFWEHNDYRLFLVYSNLKPVGRIAAIFSKDGSRGNFGFFECLNDKQAAKALIKEVRTCLAENGISSFTGPVNPSVNYELGVLSDGFDQPPFFMMNYNLPYYVELLEQAGGMVEMSFSAFKQPCGIRDDKINRVSELLKKRYTVQLREINFADFDREAAMLCDIYNDAFKNHWGYMPFTEKEFIHMARSMKLILNKKLIFALEFEGKPVAFILAIPNMNEAIQYLPKGKLTPLGLWKFYWAWKKIQWVKLTVAAVREKYQHLGLGSLLYAEIARRIEQEGYKGGEISWVAADQIPMNKIVREVGAQKTKSYKIYRF